ncbi:FAD binding domain-containing protein [Capillimicrobium parvum]|uniref:6-hydroxypseudooxynicotine dehydrogenase complex subunit alpha n=1 Tax=Capillimicrobium parvum TaxID=2884022 RepID=A0A9E7C330_9ACTN|nr:FAD binding domain-containing protein [Capillimicrobium parvum]UGS38217.1 6-hydroxypseudooxynicotine dehydrogenase complex subunit alpha [Capillimicrobium parvum]
MKPPPFTYLRARTLEEALDALAQQGAVALAGGQTLIPLLNFGDLAPATLVDINALPALGAIEETPEGLAVGALARHAQVESSPVVRRRCPPLAAAARLVAHPPVRARGTFGGSLAHGHPCAELTAVVAAAGGQIELRGAHGSRTVDHTAFAHGTFDRALAPGELITGVRLPAMDGAAWGVHEITRRTREYAMAGAVAALAVDRGVIARARVALFGVEAAPRRIGTVEELLVGAPLVDAASIAVADAARDAAVPRDDPDGDSPDYRRHLAGVAIGRAVAEAVDRGAHT